jgi:CRISPR/Cas system-associated exonuclease Cas4 (RecB family)
MVRIESPSSVNTYFQCPRKYYYSYKLKLPRTDSIATITGKSVHDALEKFFVLGSLGMTQENYVSEFQHRLMSQFNDIWAKAIPSLLKLNINKDTITKHYNDTMGMLRNFAGHVINQINAEMKKGKTFQKAFSHVKPQTEIHLTSDTHMVQGYVDALHEKDDFIKVVDYKTSKRDHMSEDYRRQLAIYALLYHENFNKLPNKVGLYFLRQGTERDLDVDFGLVEEAKEALKKVHESTNSELIEDYPKEKSPLCKWSTGQCDFYESCFKS